MKGIYSQIKVFKEVDAPTTLYENIVDKTIPQAYQG